jgi:hypothetical protein
MAIEVADRRYPDVVFNKLHIQRFIYSCPPGPKKTRKGVKAIANVRGIAEDGSRVYLPEALRFSTGDFDKVAVGAAIASGESADPGAFVALQEAHLDAIDERHEAGDITLAETMAWFEYALGLLFTLNGALDGFEGVE